MHLKLELCPVVISVVKEQKQQPLFIIFFFQYNITKNQTSALGERSMGQHLHSPCVQGLLAWPEPLLTP